MPTPLRNTTPSRGCRDRGFSIIELLVAMAIAASLVVTITTVAQLFSRQVEEVRDTEGTQLERAMDQFVQQVSAAWIVEQPSDVRVDIQDAYGAVTSIYLGKKGTLYMSRPSGTLGVLLEDVADVEFSVSTTRRLREGAPVSQITPLQTIPNNGPEDTLVIDDGDAVAVAFTPPLPAPNGLNVVSGVTEEMLGPSLQQFDLRIGDMGYNLPHIEGDAGTGSDEVDKASTSAT
jgi:prepilin-type N-terminal cleavage/methylation domain-containing protein